MSSVSFIIHYTDVAVRVDETIAVALMAVADKWVDGGGEEEDNLRLRDRWL